MSQQLTDLNQQITITIFVRRPTYNGMTVKDHAGGIVAGTHSVLDHSEFETMFGASDLDIDSVVQFVKQAGLTVTYSHCCAASVIATGTVGQINSAFGITLIDVTTPDRTYMIYDGAIILPVNLNNIIDHIDGLDTSAYAVSMNEPRAIAAIPTSGYNTRLVKPQAAATAYSFPGNNDGTDGVGQVIAVVQPWDCGYTQQNLNSTFAEYGITGTTVVDYLLDGKTNDPANPRSANTNAELMLDVAMVAGIVPKATVVVYICATLQSALNAILYDPQNKGYLPKIVSISVSWTNGNTTADNLLYAATILGVTVIASSGDWGAYNLPINFTLATRGYDACYPAASPYVLAIGGTSLALNPKGSIASEVTWNNNGEDYFITGGNQSSSYPVPSWQTGITLKNYATGVSSAPTGRATPDVALVADPYTGFTYYYYDPGISTNQINTFGGGTSASAPLWAGLIARINQLKGSSVGFINNTLYSNRTVFNDILPTEVANNNAYLGIGFSTTQGWDATTGLGSPNGTALAALFVVSTTPPITLPTNQNVDYNSLGTVINLNVNGSYTLVYIQIRPQYGVLTINNLIATYKPNRGYHGIDTFKFYTSNSAGDSNVSQVTLTILDPQITLSPSPDALPAGTVDQRYLINLTVSGGQSPYSFKLQYGNLPEGIRLVDNTLSGKPKYSGTYNFGILASDSSYPIYATATNNYNLQIINLRANFSWLTAGGSLFAPVQNGSYVTLELLVTPDTRPVFSIIAGSLPEGITLVNSDQFSGYISGFIVSSFKTVTYTFVIRARSPYFKLPIDRAFSITVLPYDPPVWSYPGVLTYLQGPNPDNSFNDLSYVNQQLIAVAPANVNTSYNITYNLSTNSSKLPNGLKLSSTGTISGIIALPINNQTSASNTYNFVAIASSLGVSTSRSFVMTVTYYNSIYQPPVFLIKPNLGSYRINSSATIPIVAYDPYPAYGGVLYSKTNGDLPNGLRVDSTAGVVTGVISPQVYYSQHYQFEITATKINVYEGITTSSRQIFSMDTLQNNYNSISWVTPTNLGTLYTSIPSGLRLVATHTETNYNLSYYPTRKLPNGLYLDSSGDIVGIPTYPGTYNITAVATTSTDYDLEGWGYFVSSGEYPALCAINTFVLTILDNPLQYTNIYAIVMPPIPVRLQIQQILKNTDIFKLNYIYRPEDPNFGVVSDLKMYLQYGIQQLSSATDYQYAFLNNPLSNHEKTFYIGTPTMVTAYDSSNTALYDVVYLTVTDSDQGTSILNKIQSKFLSLLDNQIDVNLLNLPVWQNNTNYSFIYGIVLCYAVPGKGSAIIRNLKANSQISGHFDLSTINFTIDRFIIDKTLTANSKSYLMLP